MKVSAQVECASNSAVGLRLLITSQASRAKRVARDPVYISPDPTNAFFFPNFGPEERGIRQQ